MLILNLTKEIDAQIKRYKMQGLSIAEIKQVFANKGDNILMPTLLQGYNGRIEK